MNPNLKIKRVRLIEQCLFVDYKHPELKSIEVEPGMGITMDSGGIVFTYSVGGLLANTFVPMHNVLQIIFENYKPKK